MTLSEKVAYLKGVAEGLKFDPEASKEGKLISIMMDILEHIALNAEENDDSIQALADQIDDVSDSLAMLEDAVYSEEFHFGDDDDEDDDLDEALAALEEDGYIELECPNCSDTIVLDMSALEDGTVTCPGCGQAFEVELGYEDEDEEDDEDEDEE